MASGRRPGRCLDRPSRPRSAGSRRGDAAARGRPVEHPARSSAPDRAISPSRGRRLGPVPEPAQRRPARGASATARTNRSPFSYCSILRSMPVSRSIARSNGVRRWPSLVEPRRDPLDVRDQPRPDLVHDVVAEALEQAHHRLGLAEQAASARRPSASPSSARRRASPRSARPSARQRLPPQRRARRRRTASAGARGARRGTAAARGAPRTRRRGSSRGARSRSGTARAGRRGLWPCWRMFSSTNSSRPAVGLGGQQREVVLAEDALAHEPEQEAELAGRDPAVGERHRRPGEPAAGRHDLVEQLVPPACRSATRTSPMLARTQPARSTTPERSTTPGSSVPSASAERGHDAGHGLGVGRLRRRAARPASARPGAFASRPIAMRSTAAQSTRPCGRVRSARRPTTVAAAPSAEPMRNPACQRPVVAPATRSGGAPVSALMPGVSAASSSTASTSRNAVAEHAARRSPRTARRRRSSAGCAAVGVVAWAPASSRPGRLEAVDREQLGERGGRRRRRIDDRDAVAGDRRDERPEQRVVGAAEQQRVDRAPTAAAGRSNSPSGVALAEQRRQRLARPSPRPPGRSSSAGLDHRHERRASRARRPRRPGSRP